MSNGDSQSWQQGGNPYANMTSDQVNQLVQDATGQPATQYQLDNYKTNPALLNAYTIGGNFVPNTNTQTGFYGQTQSSGVEQGGLPLGSFVQAVQAAAGGGGGNQNTQGVQTVPISQAAQNAAVNLGAAALNMPAVYNPTPQQAGKVSGVGKAVAATQSQGVPTAPQGPWNQVGSIFNPTQALAASSSGPNITPTTPANAATARPAGTPAAPYATAPPQALAQAPAAPGGAPAGMPGPMARMAGATVPPAGGMPPPGGLAQGGGLKNWNQLSAGAKGMGYASVKV